MSYLLFAGHLYYPCGGALDLVGSYESVEQAVQAAQSEAGVMLDDYMTLPDWWHVMDTKTFKVVAYRGNFWGDGHPTLDPSAISY